MGDLEVARVGREDLGDVEALARRVVPAHRRLVSGMRHDRDGDSAALQVRDEARIRIRALEARLPHQPLGRLLESRKVVLVFLQDVGDFLRRQPRRVDPEQVAAVRNPGGHSLHGLERVAVRVVQLDDRPRDRLVRRRLPQVGRRHVVRLEEGVAEDLVEVGDGARLPIRPEALEVLRIQLGQPQQQRRRQGPLVVLDQVQVRGRDVELLRQVHLPQCTTPAQEPDLGAELRFTGH